MTVHVLESYEEHHVADVLTMELAAMKPSADRFDARRRHRVNLIEAVSPQLWGHLRARLCDTDHTRILTGTPMCNSSWDAFTL